tara:strand:+ start:142 stop:657 length:516 start_codon:yes stop_codon:yes gene_type:complete
MLGLGLGSTFTSSSLTESIIILGGFSQIQVTDEPDDENVKMSARSSDSATVNLLGISSASSGDQLGGDFTLTVKRVDNSFTPIAGATSTGTVHAYKASSNGFFISDDDSSNIALSNFNEGGSALIDLTSFGGTDITDASATTALYTFELALTGAGHSSITGLLIGVDLDSA